ncbi:DNA-cytosine methyltransferase [Rippkaea orientalis PCC 8801]|uniref:Cytosine-specific methyltransferase n=1 Tax=Rippkaea orientalis (strain PCC 8801 / RF-1) TaxID=41431 RepID=B7K0D4_RIPO1|nr:DNA cytosine methyltransferase [Rippkaea orientalis]ACK67418.1 DNA-cytosine methyltransferase [Rippkaea orientalis PCC 8801]
MLCSDLVKQIEIPIHEVIVQQKFTFIDLFAGIGGFRIALKSLGGKCLGFSEIDKQAIKVYQHNFINYLTSDEREFGDITQIPNLPQNVDIIVGGVPCQPWSVAGQLKGFEDPRGRLWFDVIRLIQNSQPKSFILENVKGLAFPKNKANLDLILSHLEQAGYSVKWQVLNAYDFGLPQNRDRVFLVGIRNDIEGSQNYQFPDPLNIHPKVLDILDDLKNIKPIKKVKLSEDVLFKGFIPPSRTRFQKNDELNDFFVFSDLRNGHTTIHSWDIIDTTERQKLICLTHLKQRRCKIGGKKDGHPLAYQEFLPLIPDLKIEELNELVEKQIFRIAGNNEYEFVNSKNMSGINGIYRIILPTADIIPTLTARGSNDYIATVAIQAEHPDVYKKLFLQKIYKPRKYIKITATHARKLQGFPSDFQFHPKEDIAKRQFGNAVPVPAVEYVAKELLKIILKPFSCLLK